ncbi:MAG: hypothetical protein WDZ74_02470 [Candidatus Paceibacterota bacterium]
MTTFALTGSYHPEEVSGKQCISVYCLVKGAVRFTRLGSGVKRSMNPRDDESGKQLVLQIRELNKRYSLTHPESVDADIIMDNVIVVRFLMDELYNRDIVTELYDAIHRFCIIELALSTTPPRETLNSLYKQMERLLREIKSEKEKSEPLVHVEYLVSSIRYGTLDVFGGVIPSNPQSYTREALLTWLMPITKHIIEEKQLP